MSKKAKIKLVPLSEIFEEQLRSPEFAVVSLSQSLAEMNDDIDENYFWETLRILVKIQGFAKVANRAGLGRESLYKTLSGKGSPKLKTILAILKALGMRPMIVLDQPEHSTKSRTKKRS